MADAITVYRGRCHKFGDDLNIDTAILPYKYKIQHPFDAEKLVPHLFEELVPDFHKKVSPGDFIVAGRNFACGKPHPQGFMAIAALKLVLLCESMPYNAYRGGISSGVICNRRCAGIGGLVSDGDTLEIDFATGRFSNVTTGATAQYASIPGDLLAMMQAGGMKAMLRKWQSEHFGSGGAGMS